MNKKRLMTSLAAFALTLGLASGGSAIASEIYKWVDSEGNVHYGDRPAGTESTEVVALTYQRANPSKVASGTAAQGDLSASLKEKRAARQEAKKTAAEEAAAAEAKQKKCDTYRARLETFVQSRRLYREDASGERVYLDETETNAARQKVEELIAENCN